MSERPNKPPGPIALLISSMRFRRWTACAVAFVILYWGMMGPLSWYNHHGYLAEPLKTPVRVMYFPIRHLCEKSPMINEYIGEFADLWAEPEPRAAP
ncbi:MAG: hypothetical protein ACT4QC_07870 [Planctomycetaceae bacterium]